MSLGAILLSSLLATLAHPVAWPVALAGFLVRGGLVVFLLPIVALPSPVGLSDRLAPTLSSLVLGGATVQLAILFGAICALTVALVLLLAWFAAATEAALIRYAPAWDELDPARPIATRRRGESGRILTARLIAHVPFALALGWGGIRVVDATYRELSRPVDVTTPIALRVLGSVPEVIVVVIVTWVIGQIVGAVASRRVVLSVRPSPGVCAPRSPSACAGRSRSWPCSSSPRWPSLRSSSRPPPRRHPRGNGPGSRSPNPRAPSKGSPRSWSSSGSGSAGWCWSRWSARGERPCGPSMRSRGRSG